MKYEEQRPEGQAEEECEADQVGLEQMVEAVLGRHRQQQCADDTDRRRDYGNRNCPFHVQASRAPCALAT